VSAIVVRILSVGSLTQSIGEMRQRLERRGWAIHEVATLREAAIVLKTVRFPLVLAAEKLQDGSGYELRESVEEQESTLIVALKLSETLLWLPVVEEGESALGRRALNPVMLETEIDKLLTALDRKSDEQAGEKLFRGISSGPVLQDAKSMGETRNRGGELKASVPPLRNPRKAVLRTGGERSTGTNGKHWRG
jgi:DNA-binding NtrC family response regulator